MSATIKQIDKKKTLAPKLRFKGFDGGWKTIRLGELGTFKNGLNKDSSEFGHGIPFVNLMDVFGKTILEEADFGLVNATEKDIEMYSLRMGDVLFIRSSVKRSGVGETILVAKNLPNTVYSGFLIRFRDGSQELDLNFKSYCFSNTPFRNELLSYATSSANTNINQDSLSQIKLHFPTLPEQQKIASFLSAIDEKIQQLTRKKELLEQYKKGVMQQLFSGKLRFKDENGKTYPKWEEKRLGDLIEFTNGKGHEQIIDEKGKYIVVNSKFVSTEGRVKKYCNIQISPLSKGDIVMVMSDVPNGKALAKCYLIDEDNIYTLNQRICALKKKNNVNEFLIYLINRNEYYLSFDSGVGQTNLKKEDVLNCPLTIPVSPEEQKKIANYLSSIDNKIVSVNKQISQTQIFKKGLLQQMFV